MILYMRVLRICIQSSHIHASLHTFLRFQDLSKQSVAIERVLTAKPVEPQPVKFYIWY